MKVFVLKELELRYSLIFIINIQYTLPFSINTVKSTIPLDIVWLVYLVNVTMLMVD